MKQKSKKVKLNKFQKKYFFEPHNHVPFSDPRYDLKLVEPINLIKLFKSEDCMVCRRKIEIFLNH